MPKSPTHQITGPVTLGCIARDKLTGFTGVVVAETKWLNGCLRWLIQSQTLKDGKTVDESFDAQQVEYVKDGPVMPPPAAKEPDAPAPSRPGGPFPSPTRPKDPK